jgi:cell division protein FtsB
MLNKIKKSKVSHLLWQLSDMRTLGMVVFGVIVLTVSWSGVKAIQQNYELQKQISRLEQENTVKRLENENQKLRNKYYETDQYLELAARRQFGLAAPGETVVIIPKAVAIARVADIKTEEVVAKPATVDTKPDYQRNLEAWLNFFLGRQD